MANAEKERQFFSDTEALLNSQRAKSAAANERLMATNADLKREAEVLQKQLEERSLSPVAAEAPLSAGLVAASQGPFTGQAPQSQTTLLASLEVLQAEVRDLKASNSTLRSENESYLAVINEKTLSEAQAAENAVLDLGVEDEDDDDDSGAGENSNGDVADVPRRKPRRQPSSPGNASSGGTLGDELDERNRRSREGSEEMSNDLASELRAVLSSSLSVG
jgi:cell division protein FtsB